MVIVNYQPPSIDLTQTNRQPEIEIDILSIDFRSCTAHRGSDKRHVIAGDNIHFLDIEDGGSWAHEKN